MTRARVLALVGVLSALAATGAAAQQRVITGRVLDATTNAPVPQAAVALVGTTSGVFTRTDGTFSINAPEAPVQLQVTRIGFRRQLVSVPAGSNAVSVSLETDVLGLEEVVVTGQATGISRRNLANTVASVDASQIGQAPASSIEQMLAGKMAGVVIQQNSGAPGGGSRVRLRGITSIIGPGQPLYVIDGVIVSDARFDGGMNAVSLAQGRTNISSTEQMSPINRIADLNPDIIERVEVLKGASAAAIYGSKAANGVILITTKRGRIGEPQFSVRQSFGVAERAFTYGSRYFNTLEDAVATFGPRARDHWTPGYAPISLEDQLSGNRPVQTETSLSMSGGTETTRYFASALVRHEPGIVVNTYADKASLRLNLDQAIGSRVTLSAGLEGLRSESDRGMFGNDNAGTSYYFVLPHHPNFYDLRAHCPDGSRQVRCEGGVYPENPFVASNPLQSAEMMKREETVWRTLGSSRLAWEAMSTDRHQLRLSVNGGLDQFTQEFDLVSPPELWFEDDNGLPGTRVLSYARSFQTNVNANAVHTFQPLSSVRTTTSLGIQFEREDVNVSRSVSRGLIGGTANLSAGVASAMEEVNREIKDLGFFAQEEVLVGDRFLFTVGGRADRSSNNADTESFYFYPKASTSYRFPVGGPLTELKLRAAFGQSGNRPEFGQKYSSMVTTNVQGVGGLRVAAAAGGPTIKPERQTEIEGGYDAVLFDGQVLWEVTAYQKTISDLLLQRTLAPTTGFSSEVFNGGKLRVRGVETVVNATPVRTRDWTWSTVVNWAANRNTVLELPVPAFIARGFYTQGAIVIEEGKSATQWVANDTLPGAFGSTNPQVQVRAQGNAEPLWTGGVSNTLRYQQISLTTTVDAVKGGLINLGTWRQFDNRGNGWDHDDIDPATGVKKGVLRRTWAQRVPRTHTRDASHIKLRELNLSYDVHSRIANRVWSQIEGARISLSGRNLLTDQKLLGGDFYRGADPEVANYNSGAQGPNNVLWTRELASYPSSRSLWLSIDLRF
jgi:TonB-dependent starch-binding outer membrane protein SusC